MISSDVLLSSYDSSTGATLDLAGNEIVAFLGQPITNNISGVQIVPFAANTGVTANTSTGDVTLAANGNGTWSTMLLDLDTVGSYVEWTQPATTSLSRFFTVAIGSTQTVTANGFDARIYENFSYYFIRGTNNLGAGDVAVPWVAGQKCRLYLDTTDLLYQTSPDNGVTWETKNTESNIAAAKRGSHIPAYVLVTTTTANTKQLAIKAKGLIPFQIKIIFDGDSITQGANTTTGFANSNVMAVTSNMDYPAQLYRKSTRFAQCRNFGISAQKITDMMADFNTEIAPLINTTLFSKNVLVCWGGTNDIATGTSGGLTTFNNVKSYCLNARSFGFKVVVCNMIARTGLFSGGLTTGSFATEQAIFNSNIASDWATFADAFVDVNGLNLQSTTGWDGVHPADAGYTLAANAIYTGVMSV
jgi:lysophospholipase L1-like esterase